MGFNSPVRNYLDKPFLSDSREGGLAPHLQSRAVLCFDKRSVGLALTTIADPKALSDLCRSLSSVGLTMAVQVKF